MMLDAGRQGEVHVRHHTLVQQQGVDSRALLPHIPPGRLVITESGIHEIQDVDQEKADKRTEEEN